MSRTLRRSKKCRTRRRLRRIVPQFDSPPAAFDVPARDLGTRGNCFVSPHP
jgi:hypothetical protein